MQNISGMPGSAAGIENGRPVYVRELPPGRKLVSAPPGFYYPDGKYVPWEKACAESPVRIILRPDGALLSAPDIFRGASDPGTVLVLPDTVRSIAAGVFAYSGISSAVIPQGVTDIGRMAFYGARLAHIFLPPSLKTAGDSAFCMSGLRSAVFPEGTVFGDGALSGIPSLVYVTALSSSAPENVFLHTENAFLHTDPVARNGI